jgi:hypothetical protein
VPNPKVTVQVSVKRQPKTPTMPSTWLQGTWHSDKKATVAGWGKYPPASIEFQELLDRTLGKLVIRYTAKRSYTEFKGEKTASPYCVLWENKDSLFLVTGRAGEEQGELLNFVSPTQYWVPAARYIEFFTKRGDA